MNKYDMSEFLEYCINSCSPSGDGNDDTCNIKNLKIGIKKFSIKHKKDIMDLFSFSENNGKYVSVYAVDLVSIIDEYEQYHNDMVKFIQSLQDITNERVDNIEKFQKLLDMAKKADDNFMSKLFSAEPTKMVFSEAVKNTEVLMRLSVLADQIFDNYIELSKVSENTESARVSATIDLYKDSTKRFITSISDKFFSTMEMLFEVKDGKNPRKFNPSNGAYKLI